ncbi:hypothetical protein AB0E13_21030 [Streptomyces tendae]
MFTGSADRQGRADVTPRGGPAGFVPVLDEQTPSPNQNYEAAG